jgi:hypothetical protein
MRAKYATPAAAMSAAVRTPHPRAREARPGARRERANLRVQLQDTRATVGTLRRIMAVILQAVNCFFWLAIYNVRGRPAPAAARPPRGRAPVSAARAMAALIKNFFF